MKEKKEKLKNCRLGTVGGEAVLEGVMMNGRDGYAVACRREDGGITITRRPRVSLRKKYKILNTPILRGIIGMVESLLLSFKVLNISAEAMGLEDEEPSKFEKWLSKHFGRSIIDFVMIVATILGVGLALVMFMWLPAFITTQIDALVKHFTSGELGLWKNVVEGVIKIGIFVGYLALVSLMKDIRRTFEYHGAEHKSIFCYESGEELTPENAAKFKRFHPRCGTSFLFVVLVISILIFSLPFVPWDNTGLRLLIKIPLIPLIIGIGFEFIMLTGKHDNKFTRALAMPGMLMQHLTTREPDREQLEIAICALKSALPEEFPEFAEEHERREAELKAKNSKDTEPESEPDACTEPSGEQTESSPTEPDVKAENDPA